MPCHALPCPALHCVQDAVGPAFHSLRRVTAHFAHRAVWLAANSFGIAASTRPFLCIRRPMADAPSLFRAGLIPKFRCSRRAGGSTRFGASLSAVRYHCSVPTVQRCSVPIGCRRTIVGGRPVLDRLAEAVPSCNRWTIDGKSRLQDCTVAKSHLQDCTVAKSHLQDCTVAKSR